MKRVSLCTICLLFCMALPTAAELHRAGGVDVPGMNRSLQQASLFIENRGQFVDERGQPNDAVRYLLAADGFKLQLRATGFSYEFQRTTPREQPVSEATGRPNRDVPPHIAARQRAEQRYDLQWERIDVSFVGASERCRLSAEEPSTYQRNYYLAHTPEEGITGVREFRRVVYHDVWPGIDVIFSIMADEAGSASPSGGVTTGRFKYEFHVHAGARLSDIRLAYDGGGRLVADESDGYTIETTLGNIDERIPHVYTMDASGRMEDVHDMECVVERGQVGYRSPEDAGEETLVIDPIVTWSTYYGGSERDDLYEILPDGAGGIYLGGRTGSANNIATSGTFQTSHGGGNVPYAGYYGDAFYVRCTAAGTRLWGTYYGGTGFEWTGSLALDGASNLVATGRTDSPTGLATAGAYQTAAGNTYLVKLSSSGTRVWGTYFQASAGDGVDVDAAGNIYISGEAGGAIPVTAGAHQTVHGGYTDGFLARLNPTASALDWCTYLGGQWDDYLTEVHVNGATVYGSGFSASPTNIASPSGVHQSTWAGGYDVMLVRFTTAGTFQWGTYYGGASDETNYMLEIVGDNVFLAGSTASGNGISTPGVEQEVHGGGATDGFIAKFTSSGRRAWGTYVGDAGTDRTTEIVSRNGLLYVCGGSSSSSGMATPCQWQTTIAGGMDGIVLCYDTSGHKQWGTYVGGPADDEIGALVVSGGELYGCGTTSSTSGIVGTGGMQPTFGGGQNDGFVFRLEDAVPLETGVVSGPLCAGASIPVPFTARGAYGAGNVFTAQLSDATGSFASPVTIGTLAATTSGVIAAVIPAGTPAGNAYRIRVISSSPARAGCGDNGTDIVIVARPGAVITPAGPTSFCAGGSVVLNANTGTGLTHAWLRNGTPISGATAASHTATQAGGYQVIVSNGGSCSDTSAAVVVAVLPSPGAAITAGGPTSFCAGGSVVLNANTGTGLTHVWLRDGSPISGATAASYTATQAGAYRVVVTNTGGCFDTSSSVVVTILAGPGATITAGGPTSFCPGGTVALSANTGTGLTYLWMRDGATISGATAAVYTATLAGAYRVVVTNSSGCRDTSAAVVVTMLPGPGATITAGGPTSFCAGGSVVLNANTGTGLSHVWLRDGAVISGATAAILTVSQAGAYRVVVTSTGGCRDTSVAIVVTVLPSPGATITAVGPTSFCAGGSVLLNANTGTGLTHVWLLDGTPISGATAASHTATQAGSYRVVVTNAGGCFDTSAAVVVTVIAGPGATITAGGPTTFCTGASVVLSANTGSGLTHVWLRDGAVITGATAASLTASLPGAYRVVVTNTGGCHDTSAAVVVGVHPSPSVDAGPDATVCAGEMVVIGQPATGGTGPYIYSWSPTGGLNNPAAMQPQATPTATTDYVVMVSDANGCEDRDTIRVTVLPAPAPVITPSGPLSLCAGDSVVLHAPAGQAGYLWSPDGEVTAEITVRTTGSRAVQVTDGNGCRGTSAAVQVVVHPLPDAQIAGPVAVCPNTQAEYAVQQAGGVQYVWTVTNGTLLSGAGTAMVRVQWGTGGSGTVDVTVSDPVTGCSASALITVQIRSTLQPRILPASPTICDGGSVDLDAGPGYASYQWSSGEATRRITVSAAGRYIVSVDDGSGCQGSDTVDVVALPPVTVDVDADGPIEFCRGSQVSLRTRQPFVRYRWMRDSGPTGDTTRSITAREGGVYMVEVEDASGCRGTSSMVTLTVHDPPEAHITGPGSACVGSVLTYTDARPELSHAWQATGGVIEGSPTDADVRIRWGSVGSGLVQLVVHDVQTGCSDTTELAVTITAGYRPRIAVMGDTLLCAGDTVTLVADAGYAFYEWSTGERTRSIIVTTSGVYQVKVADSTCEGSSHPVQVVVRPRPAPVITASGATTLCEGDSVVLRTTLPYTRFRWMPGGETTDRIVVRTAGEYSVEVEDVTGCTGVSTTVVVAVAPLPDATFGGVRSACAGSRQQYTGRADAECEYTWTVAGGTLLSGQGSAGIEVEWTAAGRGSVSLRVRNRTTGCTMTVSDSVTVATSLRPTVTVVGGTTLCEGQSTILRADKGYLAYRWSSGEATDSIVVRSAGTYSVTVTDAGGCSGTSSVVAITVEPLPAPVISANGPLMFCRGGSVELTSAQPHAGYRWSTGETTRSIIVGTSGSYRLTATNAAGCVGVSDPVVVTVRPINAPRIAGRASVCTGSTVQYTVVDDTTGAFSHAWQATGGTIIGGQGGNRVTVTWGPGGRLIVVKTETVTGCIASDTMTVTAGSSITPRLTMDRAPELCEGDSIRIDAEEGFATYHWSTGASTRSITVRTAGSYTVNVTDTAGCTGVSDPVTVHVHAPPVPVLRASGATTFCLGDSITLSTTQPHATYRWSTGETTAAITVKASGSYQVTVTNAAGCVGVSGPMVVTVTPTRAPAIGGPPSLCVDETAEYAVDPDPSVNLAWTVHGPGVLEAGQGTERIRVRWTAEGVGAVEVTATDKVTGCTARSGVLVEVTTTLTPYISVHGATTLCEGERAVLRASPGYASYQWSTGATTDSIEVTAAGIFTVTVRSTSGCTGTSPAVIITVAPTPQPVITTQDATMFCAGDSARLDAGAGFTAHRWWRDGQPLPDTSRTLLVRMSGVYTVTVTNTRGCTGLSAPMMVVVFPPATPVITVAGLTLTSTGADQYQWFRNDTLIVGATERTHEASASGSYTVRITDRNGCTGRSDPVTVEARVAQATVTVPTLVATPGEVIRIPVVLSSSQYFTESQVTRFTGTVRFDKTLLHPLDLPYTDSGQWREVAISGQVNAPTGTLTEIACMALLGAAESTPVELTAFTWDQPVTTTVTSGVVHMNLCHEGGTRLYHATGHTRLQQNRPNPFNAMTMIEYEVIEQGPTRLWVSDMHGRKVASLIDGVVPPGRYLLGFDASQLPSGQYLCMLLTPSERHVIIMTVVK